MVCFLFAIFIIRVHFLLRSIPRAVVVIEKINRIKKEVENNFYHMSLDKKQT